MPDMRQNMLVNQTQIIKLNKMIEKTLFQCIKSSGEKYLQRETDENANVLVRRKINQVSKFVLLPL